MTQSERRIFLIQELLKERHSEDIEIPKDSTNQKRLLRALFNVRPPIPAKEEFLKIQNRYLQEATREKGIADYKNLTQIAKEIYLWQGDITRLKCDCIVNAANSRLLGCFHPNHGCIDNAIHTYAGVQLRLVCNEIMEKQGKEEMPGRAKITPAFNLPSKYVIHTVGPIVSVKLQPDDCRLLKSCYNSCLDVARKNGLKSIAFCCISTGEFHFPNERAAEIAVETVKEYKLKNHSEIEVRFNVFKDADREIYERILSKY